MHELTLAENVIHIVENAARQAGAARVTRVRLAIGMLACVEPDTLLFCCQLAARDGPAAGAVFEVEQTPASARCEDCAKTVMVEHAAAPCPDCGNFRLNVIAGDEMRVLEIAVV